MLTTIRTFLTQRTSVLPSTSFRTLSTTPRNLQQPSTTTSHTTDSYAKEVDTSPPPVGSTVHRVDPSNDAGTQKPNEDSSATIRAHKGNKPKEYETAQNGTESQPYGAKGGQDRRYGGKETYEEDKGSETSREGQGPAGSDASGRK
ncbi:hypothetical protein BDQ17DRAFT_1542373 [Cyathus striatus]|nr:hypothetical protein BDQ17DRAFT_1542373 [Cyathus striatus]